MTRLHAPSAQPAYLRQRDAAAFLSVSVALLQKWHRLGTGPRRVLLGGRVPVYFIPDLHRWAQEQAAQ